MSAGKRDGGHATHDFATHAAAPGYEDIPSRNAMATLRTVTVAATQRACSPAYSENVDAAEALVRQAATAGAQVILLQELFATQYFCQEQCEKHFHLAKSEDDSPLLKRFQALAEDLQVVLPVSFFERRNNAFFNSVVVYDADGTRVGIYRKSHIPDGPGYQEKFYFNPGDTGFKVFNTRFAKIGVAICWDQWFPEAARAMALQGAELLLYPTAIGSEPQDPSLNSRGHWRRVMQGHAGANIVPVIAANRVGCEVFPSSHINFYGSSFIADHTGNIVAECDYFPIGEKLDGASEDNDPASDRHSEGEIALHTFDLESIRIQRASWGLFRDRRPTLYRSLLSLDGRPQHDSCA